MRTFGTIAETRPFAMRRLLALFFTLAMGFFALSAQAQAPDSGVYEVTDVAADVTADSAVHARTAALQQAQRTAFQQLLQRLDADAAIGTKASDDDIAALVQSFEVQNERSSRVRYIGTYTIQFQPVAVRNFLDGHNAAYTDATSKPVLVLPVFVTGGHPVLWEETTKWREAWESGSHGGGLVPVIVPQGGLDDIALLSTDETMNGNADAIAALINKYQGGSALVAILTGDTSKPGSPLTIEMRRYDGDGHSLSDVNVILSVPADKKDADTVLAQAVRQARSQLETEWQQQTRGGTNAAGKNGTPADQQAVTTPAGPTSHLPVNVPVATLAEWEQIRQRLDHVPGVTRAEIITLARGLSNIELEFSGDIPQLQAALATQNLSLTQDKASGAWTLQPLAPPPTTGAPAHAPS